MPFIISRSDAPSKMYASQDDGNGDLFWEPKRDKATRFTEIEAEAVVEEFAKYSDTELDIEGAKDIATPSAKAA